MKKRIQNLIFSQQDILIEDALDEFLLALRVGHRSERTIEYYRDNVGRFNWWLRKGDYPLNVADVQAAHIRVFIQYLQTNTHRWGSDAPQSNRACSDASVQTYFRCLRAFFNWCEREEMIVNNPFSGGRLQCPKARQKVMPSYSETEIGELLEACKTGDVVNRERDLAIVYLLLDTGIRATELCELRLQDVERARVKVLGKGNKERYVVLSPVTEKAIRDYVRKARGDVADDHLFIAKGGRPLTRNGLYQLVQRRAEQAGAKPGCHKFRHTFALNWAANGGPLHALQTLLGHESPTMSLKYGRMQTEQTAELHRQFSPVERFAHQKTKKSTSNKR